MSWGSRTPRDVAAVVYASMIDAGLDPHVLLNVAREASGGDSAVVDIMIALRPEETLTPLDVVVRVPIYPTAMSVAERETLAADVAAAGRDLSASRAT